MTTTTAAFPYPDQMSQNNRTWKCRRRELTYLEKTALKNDLAQYANMEFTFVYVMYMCVCVFVRAKEMHQWSVL